MATQKFMQLFIVVLIVTLFYSSSAYSTDERPFDEVNRSKVQFISSSDLSNNLEDFLILDVRSSLEYEVMHILGSYNIPMSTRGFEISVQKLCVTHCKIVTYCNGEECKKSILAAERLIRAGFRQVYVYRDGILNWINELPEKTVLLQETPAALTKLVNDKEFAEHLINWQTLKHIAKHEQVVLIDVRDYFQADSLKPLPDILNRARKVPLDRFKQAIEQGFAKNEKLVIFDEVGKQVVWLQYYLKLHNYKNYYFLTGGINQHLAKDS